MFALAVGCNSSDEMMDSANNSGSGSSSGGSSSTTSDSESESETLETASASGSSSSTTDASSSTTNASSSSTTDASSSSSSTGDASSSSTGALDPQGLCESTDGTWDETACDHYVCGQPNACEAIIPGCDCGPDANFVEGEGCVDDDACGTFACGDDLECSLNAEYCQAVNPGVKGGQVTYSCVDTPAACSDSVDCECLSTALAVPSMCSEVEPGGLIIQVFAP